MSPDFDSDFDLKFKRDYPVITLVVNLLSIPILYLIVLLTAIFNLACLIIFSFVMFSIIYILCLFIDYIMMLVAN
jgi:hypothetical protein